MPYKDPEVRRAMQRVYSRRYYLKNQEKYAARRVQHREEMKEWLATFKGELVCEDCGEDDPVCLEFHHRDPALKDFSLANGIKLRYSKGRMLEEAEKCDVLCANCHRKLHARQA